MQKPYISGGISGYTHEEYSERFARAEAYLVSEGWSDPVNPVKVQACATQDCAESDGAVLGGQVEEGQYLHDWRCYMKHDIMAMMECDFIVMLSNWKKSKGANIELLVARSLDFPVFELDENYSSLAELSFEPFDYLEANL